MKKTSRRRGARTFLFHSLALLLAALLLAPFVSLFSAFPPRTGSSVLSLAFSSHIASGFLNSVIYSLLAALLSIASSTFAGYGFARVPGRGKGLLFTLLFLSLLIPQELQLIPRFLLFSRLGLADTWIPLLLPRLAGDAALIIFLMAYVRSIPEEFDEAARLDGASYLEIFRSITLPLLKPALGTVFVYALLTRWNDFLEPLVYLKSEAIQTLPPILASLEKDSRLLPAAAILSLIPPFFLFLIFQRRFILGVQCQLTQKKGLF